MTTSDTSNASATAEISSVVDAMRHGFTSGVTRPAEWRRTQLKRLRGLLTDRSEAFEEALFHDLGKARTEAQLTEIAFLLNEIDYALAHLSAWMRPKRITVPLALQPAAARTLPEPLGVVLVIAPWNYPLMLALSPLIGAIAAGNAVIMKPSELAPHTSALLARLIPDCLDRRAVAVVEGAVPETSQLLQERFDHIFYTGNGRVGRIVARAAAEHLTPITLELGGKSPVYVDDTVSLRDAAKRIVWSKYLNAGQTCIAPDYLLASPEVSERLVPLLGEAVQELYGTAIRYNPDYGRIVSESHFDRLVAYLSCGDVAFGGACDRNDRFIEPTILTGVDVSSPIMRDEVFGPLLPVVTVQNLDEALGVVTARDKPLAAYVFSDSSAVRRRWETETSSGALTFGAPALHVSVPELPFGGVGESGMGSYHGERSFLTFSHEKSILTKPLTPDTLGPTIMPPYSSAKDSLVRKWLRRFL